MTANVTVTVPEPPENLDGMAQMLVTQLLDVVGTLNRVNEEYFASQAADGATSNADIDKVLKKGEGVSDKTKKAWAKAEKAKEVYKTALLEARNEWRVENNEEPVTKSSGGDDERDELLEKYGPDRELAKGAHEMLLQLAERNKNGDLKAWATAVEIPQIARKGSTKVGQSRPRKLVSVDGNVHENFGSAAKAITDLVEGHTFNAGDLSQAWEDAGEPDSFDFQGLRVTVKDKPPKK